MVTESLVFLFFCFFTRFFCFLSQPLLLLFVFLLFPLFFCFSILVPPLGPLGPPSDLPRTSESKIWPLYGSASVSRRY